MSPLEELRQEKAALKYECKDSEERLAQHWNYLADHAPSLLFNSAVHGITGWLGFGHKEESKNKKDDSSSGIAHNILGNIASFYPLIWDLVQPFLWKFALNKVKSLFTRKKKKRK